MCLPRSSTAAAADIHFAAGVLRAVNVNRFGIAASQRDLKGKKSLSFLHFPDLPVEDLSILRCDFSVIVLVGIGGEDPVIAAQPSQFPDYHRFHSGYGPLPYQ